MQRKQDGLTDRMKTVLFLVKGCVATFKKRHDAWTKSPEHHRNRCS